MLRTIQMDIDELRDAGIRLHGLTKADSVYTSYHDETDISADCISSMMVA